MWELQKRNLKGFRKKIRNSKKKKRKLPTSKEIKWLQDEIAPLSENLKKAKLDSEERDKRVESAKSHVAALQKQAADLLLEYDRLLEDNQNLQTQAMGYRWYLILKNTKV